MNGGYGAEWEKKQIRHVTDDTLLDRGCRSIVWNIKCFVVVNVIGLPWRYRMEARGDGDVVVRRVKTAVGKEGKAREHSSFRIMCIRFVQCCQRAVTTVLSHPQWKS